MLSHGPVTSEIDTLSLHDALPISNETSGSTRPRSSWRWGPSPKPRSAFTMLLSSMHDNSIVKDDLGFELGPHRQDRKSTRLNSSHTVISYAVFCLKKKKKDVD